jgi:hypothetical protein
MIAETAGAISLPRYCRCREGPYANNMGFSISLSPCLLVCFSGAITWRPIQTTNYSHVR